MIRCAGCGKFGALLCVKCLDLYRSAQVRIKRLEDERKKIEQTVRVKFAILGKFRW